MPLAAKRNLRNEKATPAQTDTEVLPAEPVDLPVPPKVTALIYSYNNAPALRKCLAALERSTERAKLEILVVDKGSQDESGTLDSEFPETTFLRLPRNFGTTKALNIGMRTAAGELLLFLRPEVEVGDDTIARLVSRLEGQETAVAVCPLVLDESGSAVQQAFRLPSPATGIQIEPASVDFSNGAKAVEYASLTAMLARKYFVRGINYLDDRYGEFGADAELSWQVRRAGRTVLIDPEVTVRMSKTPEPRSAGARNLIEADQVNGVAVFFGKHHGFVSGLTFRIGQVFRALFSLRFGLLWLLASGQKIDGSQGVLL